MSEKDTGFTTEGFKDVPNTHIDMQKIQEIYNWSDERVEQELLRYDEYTKHKDTMPRARAEAKKILEYIMFEWQYRKGEFAHDLRFDELCEGV